MKLLDDLAQLPEAAPHVEQCQQAMQAGNTEAAVRHAIEAARAEAGKASERYAACVEGGRLGGSSPKRREGILEWLRHELKRFPVLDEPPTWRDVFERLRDEEPYWPTVGRWRVWREGRRVWQRELDEIGSPTDVIKSIKAPRTFREYIRAVWEEQPRAKSKRRGRGLPVYRQVKLSREDKNDITNDEWAERGYNRTETL